MNRVGWLAAWMFLGLGQQWLQLKAEPLVSVFLELRGPSLFESQHPDSDAPSTGPKPASVATMLPSVRLATIRAEQDAVEAQLAPYQARVIGRMSRLVNALRVLVPESQIPALSSVPGVARVQRAHHYRPSVSGSIPWIGAPSAWSSPGGLLGDGMRIAIIDSGIDYTHADFGGAGTTAAFDANDPTVIEAGSFPTAKVVGGTDLVGDTFDSSGLHGSSTPHPDPDPMDARTHGHGSHVAGIAAGFGVTSEGATFAGPYESTLDPAAFKISPGVAPKALLYAVKVFGSSMDATTDAVPEAMDWAADPDRRGDLTHPADVANLSLGSNFGDDLPSDVELKAVDRLSRLGCVVAIASGNDGNTAYIAGTPGIAPRAITVANSNDGFSGAIRLTAPASIAGDVSAVEGSFTAQLSDMGEVTGRVVAVIPDNGCGGFDNAAALAGKIALINRGTCFFTEKIKSAQNAGAIGVIMVNNVDAPSIVMAATDGTVGTIPGVMISQAAGASIRAHLSEGVTATLSSKIHARDLTVADQIDDSSSRGPVYRSVRLKPDVAAPGVAILSVRAGYGTQGISFSGTSMATPHVAGAAALLRQAHPDWPVEDIKAALMNTAVRTQDAKKHPYLESRAGAGRIQVDRAAAVPVVVRGVSSDGRVSVTFGSREVAAPVSITRTVQLTNHSDRSVTFRIVNSNTVVDTGITVTPSVSSITVEPHSLASVDLVYAADPAKFTRVADASSPAVQSGILRQAIPESSGEMWFLADDFSLHVPWISVARAASSMKSTANLVGVPAGDPVTMTIPVQGTSAHPNPLVSVFQLGATLSSGNYSDLRSSTDLVAIGAASNIRQVSSISAARVFFAMVTAGSWLTPNRGWNDFDVEIDVNSDGRADYTVINANSGTYGAGDVDSYENSNDALETVVRNESKTSNNLVAEATFNTVSSTVPEYSDTAPYLNGVFLHSVMASEIGLSSTRTKFRYRAITRGDFNDTTAWITFDAGAPVVDGTSFGVATTPLVPDRNSVQFKVYRALAASQGYTASNPPRALVVHQHNTAGTHHDVIRLDLSTPDTDGDGMPDTWELATFGDLSHDAASDADGDGIPDLAEFLAGTDPLDPQSPFLVAVNSSSVGGAGVVLQWPSKTRQTFTVERSSSALGPFSPVKTGISATPPGNTFRDSSASDEARFYRVRIE